MINDKDMQAIMHDFKDVAFKLEKLKKDIYSIGRTITPLVNALEEVEHSCTKLYKDLDTIKDK